MCFTLLVPLRAALVLYVAAASLNYTEVDPSTGARLQCEGCPPGTYLRARCGATRKSDCAPCPAGSFTALWNYISKCLRCSLCGYNMVEKKACSADSDRQCACKQGYHFKKEFDICLRHNKCPVGQGVLVPGTPDEDTVCHVCPNGTYSDIASAHGNCTEHKSCSAPGLQLLLKGSARHDSVCVNCEEQRSQDGANYLREIFSAFFVSQNIAIRRLCRIVNRLTFDGRRQERVSRLDHDKCHDRINEWISTATPNQIRCFPGLLSRAGAYNSGRRLQNKLKKIDASLAELCNHRNEGVKMQCQG